MAKRRKDPDAEDEDKPFKLPKFDEKAFIKREKRNIKATFIAFFFGCLIALVSFGLWAGMGSEGTNIRWPLVFIFALATGSFLRYIYTRLNFDLSDFTKKNWFTTYMIYFFVWLIVFIVLVNPPFYDDEAPRVNLQILPGMQEPGGDILIVAQITDNVGVDKKDIDLMIDGVSIPASEFQYYDTIFSYTYEGPDNLTDDESHSLKLTVKDSNEHKKIKTGTFSFSNDTIILAEPDIGDAVDANDDIRFTVNTEVNRVYYTVNNESEINATKKTDSETDYETFPKYKGWPDETDANASIKVYAEVIYYFQNYLVNNQFVAFTNTIVDNDVYNFTIEDDDDVGEETSVKISLPKGKYVGTPGFEAIIFIAALLVVVLILKYKKKDKPN